MDAVSWHETMPAESLRMIEDAGLPTQAAVIDVGGGASQLAAELAKRGYEDITVADIAEEALRESPGAGSGAIRRVVADVRFHDFGRRFDLWHDRAVFHFMVSEEDQAAYIDTLRRALRPGGHLIVATFGPGGPQQCSGLPVCRYGADELAARLGGEFELAAARLVEHTTPSGNPQQFLYARFVRS